MPERAVFVESVGCRGGWESDVLHSCRCSGKPLELSRGPRERSGLQTRGLRGGLSGAHCP
jgi:hypothetical protein